VSFVEGFSSAGGATIVSAVVTATTRKTRIVSDRDQAHAAWLCLGFLPWILISWLWSFWLQVRVLYLFWFTILQVASIDPSYCCCFISSSNYSSLSCRFLVHCLKPIEIDLLSFCYYLYHEILGQNSRHCPHVLINWVVLVPPSFGHERWDHVYGWTWFHFKVNHWVISLPLSFVIEFLKLWCILNLKLNCNN
jgi:hypothetical protein